MQSGVFNTFFEYSCCLKIKYFIFILEKNIFFVKRIYSSSWKLAQDFCIFEFIWVTIIFLLTGSKIIIFVHLSVEVNYFILFISIILTHNYLLNTPGCSGSSIVPSYRCKGKYRSTTDLSFSHQKGMQ